MDKKYIVKNCPNYFIPDEVFWISCKNPNVPFNRCQNCTDCLIKQVIEKCNKCIDENYPDYYDEGFEEDIVTEFANDILQLFIIEEVGE